MTDSIYINPLSAAEQFDHITDAIAHMEILIKVLKRAVPCAEVVYDHRISTKKLVGSDTIDNVAFKLTQPNKILWFSLKNRMNYPGLNDSEKIVILENNKEVLHGEIDPKHSHHSDAWISMGGLNVLDKDSIQYKTMSREHSKINISCLAHANSFFPIYQPNPKHQKKEYFDRARNEYVSPMPLNDEKAQEFLNESHLLSNGDRVFRNRASEEFYLFKVTERNIFHGFQIKKEDLSPEAKQYFYNSEVLN